MFISVPLLGHTQQMIALAQALVDRGYRVSFLLTEAAQGWLSDSDISVIPWHVELAEDTDVYLPEQKIFWSRVSKEPSSWRSDKLMLERIITFYAPMYKSLKDIAAQHRPDCLVVDRAVVPAMDFAQQNNLPCIIQTRFLGNFVKPEPKYPQFGTSYSVHMNFWEKCLNFLVPRLQQYYLLPTLLKFNQVRQRCANQKELPGPWDEKTMIVGTSFDIELPRPLPPNIHMVGPIFPKSSPPLGDSLHDWLDSEPESPVVYMAFGTLAVLNNWQAKALVEGLTQSGLRVLWSLPKSQQALIEQFPESFRIESFVPQRAVLSHPRVSAFVSHCGMNSINEALYGGKPFLALPFFGDQHYNAARLVDLGVALKLNKKSFTKSEVQSKLNQILENQDYRDNAAKISIKLKRTHGLDKATGIIETVLQGL
ncbi:MAG: glycosyltransferase [Cyanobacteria bacterium P01_D01_bin.36]